MVAPTRVLRRVPIALLIALSVSVAVGGALAGTDQQDEAEQQLDVHVPAARLGDKGSYRLTLLGDWDREDTAAAGLSQAPYDQPWTALEFEWRQAGIGLDADGRSGPADELHVATHEWSLELQEERQWVLDETGGSYLYRSGEHVPYQRTLAYAEDEAASLEGGVVSVDGLPEPTQPLLATNAGAGEDYRLDDRRQPLPNCFLQAFQGQVLRPGARVSWPEQSCRPEHLPDGWYPVVSLAAYPILQDVDFVVVGHEGVNGRDAVHVRSVGPMMPRYELWMAHDVPVPLRFDITATHYRVEGEEGNRTAVPDGERTARLELDTFTPGTEERVPRGAWTGGFGAIALGPRQPYGMPEDGAVATPFPLSAAYALAEANATFAAFVRDHPDAYMSSARGDVFSMYGTRTRYWTFTVDDSEASIVVRASQAVPDAADGLPALLRDPLVSTDLTVDVQGPDYFHAPRSAVPDQVPTLAAVVQRWHDAGGLGEPNVWGFAMECAIFSFDCSEVRHGYYAGSESSEVHTVEQQHVDEGRAPVSTSWIVHQDTAAVELDGRLTRQVHYDRDWAGSVGFVAPADELAANEGPAAGPAARPLWQPTPTQAAGAGAVGILAGLLYALWPALKAGPSALFSRVHGPQLLEHPVRQRLAQIVAATPGIHFKELRRQSGLANGVLVHHLDKLAGSGLLKVKEAGRYRCYFPAGTGAVDGVALAAVKADGARKVLDTLKGASTGLDVRGLADATGLGRGTVHYHLQRLHQAGLVRPAPLPSEDGGATWAAA